VHLYVQLSFINCHDPHCRWLGMATLGGCCAVGAGRDHSAVRRVLSWGHSDRESAGGSPGSEPQYFSTGKPLVSVAPQSCVKVYGVS
jgi:hypothetical protein